MVQDPMMQETPQEEQLPNQENTNSSMEVMNNISMFLLEITNDLGTNKYHQQNQCFYGNNQPYQPPNVEEPMMQKL